MSGHLGLRSGKVFRDKPVRRPHHSVATINAENYRRKQKSYRNRRPRICCHRYQVDPHEQWFSGFMRTSEWHDIDVPASDRETRFIIILDIANGQTFDSNEVLALRHQFPNSRIILFHDQSRGEGNFQLKIVGTSAILNRNVDQETLLSCLMWCSQAMA